MMQVNYTSLSSRTQLPSKTSVWVRFLMALAFLSGSLSLAGCPKENVKTDHPKQLRVEDYFPLRVGDVRKYRIQFGRSKKYNERAIKMISRKGRIFSDDAKGVYQYDTHGLRGRLRYLLKYPLRVGNRWLSVVGVTTIERYRIVDTNRGVTVPAGYYRNCIVVRSRRKVANQRVLEALHFYAPKIGLIKYTIVLKDGSREIPQWNVELLSYRQGQGKPST